MATKGRDFKVSFLTDLAEFTADKAADQLDDLADSATKAARTVKDVDDAADGRGLRSLDDDSTKAGKSLHDLEADAKGGARALDTLDTQATATAGKVDDAFDRIRQSSKAGMKGVSDNTKHGMDDAGHATQTFKDEAKANLSEVASSFQGDLTSAADIVQGTLGGIVSDLGPLGLAAGAGAAAGVGLIVSTITAAKERVKELTGSFLDLRKQGIDPAADAASHLVDELDTTQLSKFGKDAREIGISMETLRAALDGNADAIEAVRAANKRYNDENAAGNPISGQQLDHHLELTERLNDTEKAYRNSADAAQVYGAAEAAAAEAATAAQEAAKQALADHAAAYTGFVDASGTYTDLLATMTAAEQEKAQKTADSTKDEKDTWEDYANSVDVSVDQYLDALERQVQAQEQWAGNLQKLAKRGVDEGVLAELERMGPEGAPLVAKLTKSSNAELTRMVTLYGRKGSAAGAAVASNLSNKAGAVTKSARDLHDAAAVELARTITVPVKLGDASRAAREAWLDADRYFRTHPITLRTKAGARPIRDVP